MTTKNGERLDTSEWGRFTERDEYATCPDCKAAHMIEERPGPPGTLLYRCAQCGSTFVYEAFGVRRASDRQCTP